MKSKAPLFCCRSLPQETLAKRARQNLSRIGQTLHQVTQHEGDAALAVPAALSSTPPQTTKRSHFAGDTRNPEIGGRPLLRCRDRNLSRIGQTLEKETPFLSPNRAPHGVTPRS